MKLTPKQKEVIEAMRKDIKLHYYDGINARVSLGTTHTTNISWATVFRLEKLNLIQRPEYKGVFTLTDLGKTITL